jgi:hypothetical protein
MGWKTINGRRYYYKPEWQGGRVKTRYCGVRDGNRDANRSVDLMHIHRKGPTSRASQTVRVRVSFHDVS